MPKVLFYADTRALSAYLGGAALLEPHLAEATCEALELMPARAGSSPLAALYFEDDGLALPEPKDTTHGTSLCKAELLRDKGELVLRGKRRQKFQLESCTPPRDLAQVLAPVPWKGPPREALEVIYLCPNTETFARLVSQHLELGRNELRTCALKDGSMLLEVLEPSWFLLERWLDASVAEDRGEGVQIFRRLVGPLGPRRIYVEWGYAHALEGWLSDPADERLLLLIHGDGTHRTLEVTELEDVGNILALDPARFETVQLEGGEQVERIPVRLRLEGRTSPVDPELWILPVAHRHRLEELLTQTPEEELRNLMVACVGEAAAPAAERVFAVREVLTGRAPRLLPLGERAYAPIPGLPNLLVPCDKVLAPPLSNDRYARAFGLRPGELTILGDAGEGEIHATKMAERAFRPVESIVDFVIADHIKEVEEIMLATPFDLGSFDEEDLVPSGARPKRKVQQPRKTKSAKAETEDQEAKTPRKRGLLDTFLKPFRGPASVETGGTAAAPESDPRQEEIERVQRELVLEAATPPRWLELSRLLFEDGQDEEALRAAESAVWELPPGDAKSTLEALRMSLGLPSDGQPKDTLELYRRVFAYQESVASTAGDVDSYRRATEGMYDVLREHQDRLRKRTRWILWRGVLAETGDVIEAERQREAILSDLVVRGIEEREVPAFVRHLLLEHYGQKAATGSGASAALGFLERAQRFAANPKMHPAYRAEASAQVAWAFAELGQGERALEVARQAERIAGSKEGAPRHDAWRARAVARVGAVLERVRGRDQGRKQLESALDEIARLLPTEPVRKQSQEMVDARKAFVSWLGSVADAWSSGDRRSDPLLRRALQLLESRPPNDQSQVIHDAPEALARLGVGDEVRELAWKLLRADELKRAREAVLDYQHPEDAYRVHVQNVVEALELYRDGEAVSAEEARQIVGLLRSQPQQLIDEFTIRPLQIALRGSTSAPWDIIEELVTELRQRGLHYEAHLVRIAGLWELAHQRERQRGADLLEQVLAEAWELKDAPKKPTHRILTRLVQLVPAFGMRERGLKVLHGVNERTQTRGNEGVYFRNELLLSTALAGSKLGDSRAAFELIAETAKLAMTDFDSASRGGRSGGPSWLLFETLDECVKGTVDLGEARRGLELVASVAETARSALAQTRDAPGRGTEGPYFYCRTLIRCGWAALALGDHEAATSHFEGAFDHFSSLSNWDLTEILQEAATVAGQLEGERRYRLAGRVVEEATEPVSSGNQDRFAVDLVSQIARDMVRGESAFASALKRWKGREERSIRDKVAHESVVEE